MKALTLIITATILFATSPVFCQVISDFTTYAEDQHAVLEWKSGVETGVVSYEIQRSFDGNRFHPLSLVSPEGSSLSYRYVDRDLFKDPSNTYYYRIKVNFANGGLQYSKIEQVTMSSSGIYRTWGSIKAMFR